MKKLTTDLRKNGDDTNDAELPTEEETEETSPQEEVKEEEYNVRLTVWVGRESTRIAMGTATIQQLEYIVNTLCAPFEALAPSKRLLLTDAKNVTHIFNGALVTHIEVETD